VEERKEGTRRMKKSAHVIVALLLAVLLQQAVYAASVKTHRNQALEFEISYFENWEESHAPGNSAFFIKRKSVQEPGTISINVANFTGNKESFMQNLKAHPDKFTEKYKQRFPSAKMLENGDTYLGGFPGYFITTNYTLKNLNIEIDIVAMQIFCIKGKKIYLVNFETPLLLFEKTFNEFQAILATFNFR
jgi:hypothetical protein